MCGTDDSNFEQIGNLSACYPYVLNDEWLLYQDAVGGETLNAYNMTDGQMTVLSNSRSFLPIVKGNLAVLLENPMPPMTKRPTAANICRIDLMTLTTERAAGFSGAYLALNGDYMFAANGLSWPMKKRGGLSRTTRMNCSKKRRCSPTTIISYR